MGSSSLIRSIFDNKVHGIAELRSNNNREPFNLWYQKTTWGHNFALRFIIVRTFDLDMVKFIDQ